MRCSKIQTEHTAPALLENPKHAPGWVSNGSREIRLGRKQEKAESRRKQEKAGGSGRKREETGESGRKREKTGGNGRKGEKTGGNGRKGED